MYICENCKKEFDFDYRTLKTIRSDKGKNPRFCCRSCARQNNGKMVKYLESKCLNCGIDIKIRSGTKKEYCGDCADTFKVKRTRQSKRILMNGVYKSDQVIAVLRAKKEKKKELIIYKGGKCYFCGYNKLEDALEFHHIHPSEKSFMLNLGGLSKSWESCFAEADKCVLVCANCHREIHAGIIKL